LKKGDFSKYTRNLAPASRTILLSGPAGWSSCNLALFKSGCCRLKVSKMCLCNAELYQQMLAKALAHFFDAKLLLLDVTDFVLKVSNCPLEGKRDEEGMQVNL